MLDLVSKSEDKTNKQYQCKASLVKQNVIRILLITFLVIISANKLSAQTNDDCLTCHDDNTLTMEKNGKEVSLDVNPEVFGHSAHKKLDCIACHVGFSIDDIPHKENIKPINCKSCHKDAALKHPFHPQMLRSNGVDGPKDVNCKGCHGTHDIISPKVPGSKFYKTNIINACGQCHPDQKKEYLLSAHGEGFKEGVKGAPNCIVCHQNPIAAVTPGIDTTQLKIAQEKLCLSCHQDNPEIRARTTPSAGFITAYEHSIHGSMLNKGNGKAANCVNCHTAHQIKDGSDPTSSVNRYNIPNTCGQCHAKIDSVYKQSIHGVAALQKGSIDAPVCTNCHGEHNILQHNNPKSPVAFQNVSSQVCSPCHSSVKMSQKYGLDPNRLSTYKASYHGLAMEGGSTVVANCASCHGFHNIKPPSDSTSTVYKGNLAKTCGKCHPGANENFAKGKIHVSMNKQGDPILYWIATIYISLIIMTIGLMLLHNIFDFIKKSKLKKLRQQGYLAHEVYGHSLYLRMNLSERIQHGTLAASFIILVITGFMLHFPDSWWVRHIKDFWQNAFEYRSILHRIAAVFMVSASLFHIYYIIVTERGRKLIKDLLPKYKDLTDALGVAKFNLGISRTKPKLDRFSYIEKAEYWALIWGTIIMTATGIIMWFDNTFIGLFTKLGWDIARTIHYYEAWLAFLAIVVWHFYFVIFSPDVYPMNLAWFKGFLSEEEMAEEHPLELEKLKKEELSSGTKEEDKGKSEGDV